MHIWHLTFAADGRHPLFTQEAERRAAVRLLARVAGSAILLYSVVDEHVHVVLFCDGQRAGRLAQALVRALRAQAVVRVDPARIKAVQNRAHMQWLVTYLLTQTEHHKIPVHPALWSGCCFADLIGARVVRGLELCLERALPRFQLRTAYRAVGLTTKPLKALPLEDVRSAGVVRLVEATAAALAVGPDLCGNTAPVVLARRTVSQLATQAGIGSGDVAWALDTTPRSARRLLRPAADPAVCRAVRLQLALEATVHKAITRGGVTQ